MKLFLSIYNGLEFSEKKKFKWIVAFIIFLLFLEIASLSLLLPIIKIIFSEEKISFLSFNFFEKFSKNQQIYFFLSLLVFFFTIKNIFNAFLIYYQKRFLYDIQINFSSRIFSHYLNSSYDLFLRNSKPEIMRNLGILASYIIVLENFIRIAIEVCILILILTIIFFSNFYLGLSIMIFSVIFIIVFLFLSKGKFKKYGELINFYNERLINNYLDSIGSIKDIILQKKQNFFIEKFSTNISKQANINVKNSFLLEIPRFLLEIIVVTAIAFLIIIMTITNENLNETTVTISFIIALIFRALPSVTRIIYQSSGFYNKIDTIKRVQNLMLTFNKKQDMKKNQENFDYKKISLKKISFFYGTNSSKKIFNDLDLDIFKNNTIGIIGSSGSGKSTLLDIICGILSPANGKIFLDDRQLDDETIYSWQQKISYISQKNYLLNGSILENVAFAEKKEEINMQKAEEAIAFAKLKSLVDEKKEGINFLIGEDGKNISGGQRQRIVLARAIYREAELIILDEATSALDKYTENEILRDIKDNFHKNKTLIISTHKAESLYFCDKIINIDNL